MTKAQERMVERLKRAVEEQDLLSHNYEIKSIEVKEIVMDRLVVFTSETGLKGDEGTAAAILCRDLRYIEIGPRGGLKGYGHNDRRIRGRRCLYEHWTVS